MPSRRGITIHLRTPWAQTQLTTAMRAASIVLLMAKRRILSMMSGCSPALMGADEGRGGVGVQASRKSGAMGGGR